MVVAGAPVKSAPLTANQKRGFLAAWGGWALDGMDSFIYALVLVPALMELLPESGIQATPANIGAYGALLFGLFLFGWGTSMVWGPIGDRGPACARDADHPVLFDLHFMCGLVNRLAARRAARAVRHRDRGRADGGRHYIAEELDEPGGRWAPADAYRVLLRLLLAAVANYFIGATGVARMFIFGAARPHGRLHSLRRARVRRGGRRSSASLTRSARRWRRRSGRCSRRATSATRSSCPAVSWLSIIMLWAGSVYVPTAARQMAAAAGEDRGSQPGRVAT